MATIDKGIPVPTSPKRAYKRKLSPLSQEVKDALMTCDVGDSFAVAGKMRSVALVAGKIAKRLAVAIRTAQDGDKVRIWRVQPKAAVATA